jgi:hypothetical protein
MGMKWIKTRINLMEGDRLPPWYYGYSYANLDLRNKFVVYHIMPFNYLARWFNNFKYFWHRRHTMSHFDTRVYHMIKQARAAAFKLGYEKGKIISEQQAQQIKEFVKMIADKRMDLQTAKDAIAKEGGENAQR